MSLVDALLFSYGRKTARKINSFSPFLCYIPQQKTHIIPRYFNLDPVQFQTLILTCVSFSSTSQALVSAMLQLPAVRNYMAVGYLMTYTLTRFP
jgi:hypothetical protein